MTLLLHITTTTNKWVKAPYRICDAIVVCSDLHTAYHINNRQHFLAYLHAQQSTACLRGESSVTVQPKL